MGFDLSVSVLKSGLAALNAGESSTSAVNRLALDPPVDALLGGWRTITHAEAQLEIAGVSAAILEAAQVAFPRDVRALSFLLYEENVTFSNESHESYDMWAVEPIMAVTGCGSYPQPEWEFDQLWESPGFVETPVLSSLAARATLRGPGDEGLHIVTYSFALIHAVGLAIAVMAALPPALLLHDRPVLGASVGFHDGDITGLGELSAAGFSAVELPAWS